MHQSKDATTERCKDSATGLTAGSNQSAVCQCLELDRRHGICPCVRFWGRVRFLSLACTCIAHAACVLFAHVCQAITPGVPHTNPLRVPVGPPLPSVYGCINITCNTNDVRKPRRPHVDVCHIHVTCTRQTHYAYTFYVRNALCYQWWLSLYVRKYSHYTPCPFLSFSSSHPPLSTSPHRLDVRAALII